MTQFTITQNEFFDAINLLAVTHGFRLSIDENNELTGTSITGEPWTFDEFQVDTPTRKAFDILQQHVDQLPTKKVQIDSQSPVVFDIYGQQIKVGRWIAYPVRRGSSLWMAYGRVTAITQSERFWYEQRRIVTKLHVTKLNGKKTVVNSISDVVQAPEGFVPNDDYRYTH